MLWEEPELPGRRVDRAGSQSPGGGRLAEEPEYRSEKNNEKRKCWEQFAVFYLFAYLKYLWDITF
jgi:hypothetical protein